MTVPVLERGLLAPTLTVSLLIVAAGCGGGTPETDAPRAADRQAVATDAPSAAAAPEPTSHVGSEACAPCHPVQTQEWSASSHAHSVRPVSVEDEELLDTLIECAGLPRTHALGDRHHVRFLVERSEVPWGEGRWLALPCGWDVHAQEVTSHHSSDWKKLPWESGCAACHVTGFRSEDHGFHELNVGCEACHGPGSRHVTTAALGDVYHFRDRAAAEEVRTCGSCHLQEGRSRRTGLKFPDAYRPGQPLLDDYEFDWSLLDAATADKALDVHQKKIVQRVLVAGDDSLRCTSCHALHGLSHQRHRELPRQEFCQTCHQPDMTLKEYSQSCNVCEF